MMLLQIKGGYLLGDVEEQPFIAWIAWVGS
jgi:hypothetical protein